MLKGTRGEAARVTSLTGKAGEYAVASQLMVRGLNVFFPAVDTGVDLLAENGCRVQIKTGHMRCSSSIRRYYPDGVYSFHFQARKFIATSKDRVKVVEKPFLSSLCDVVVLWGVEQNRFWVAPATLLDGRKAVFMGPKNARRFDKDIAEMRAMVEMGMSQKEIGEHFGIGQTSVCSRLQDAGTQAYGNSACCLVRNCENAWEHIVDFKSVERAVAEPVPQEV